MCWRDAASGPPFFSNALFRAARKLMDWLVRRQHARLDLDRVRHRLAAFGEVIGGNDPLAPVETCLAEAARRHR